MTRSRLCIILLAMLCLCQSALAQQRKTKGHTRKKYGHGVVLEPPQPEPIFVTVTQQAEFPGGNDSLQKFLTRNIRYPAWAREDEIQGMVTARLLIDTEGTIARAELTKDIGGGCGKEVLRVLKTLPPWKPYRYNGKNIPFIVVLHIGFRITD